MIRRIKMEITPYKLHVIFGLLLILAGFVFDFAFVTRNFTEAFKGDPASYMDSWGKYVYELVKFYLIVLGFLNISFALLGSGSGSPGQAEWLIFSLMAAGSVLFIVGGVWEGLIGPIYKMEPPCYVLGIGLAGILLSLVLKIYSFLR